MRSLKQFLLVQLALIASAGCEVQPNNVDPRFRWQVSVPDMRDALMSTCTHNGVVYAVGGRAHAGALYRWTSRRWLQEGTMLDGSRLWACWAGPRNTLIAVGENGTIFRRDGEGWHRDSAPPQAEAATLYSVWGMPDGTAVAVGGGLQGVTEKAVILHFDGTTWSRFPAEHVQGKNLRGVWGDSPDNYWAVGDGGEIVRWDGTNWLPSNSQVDDRLYAIDGAGPNEMYAVGGTSQGLILRWNGSSWLTFDTPATSLRSVWTTQDSDLVVVGEEGFAARYTRLNGLPRADRVATDQTLTHLRINDLIGLSGAYVGTASTSETAEDGDWRGAVVSQGRSFGGPVFEDSTPDAGVPDAGPSDAGPADASLDAASE
jgi:hypothetical protein